MKKLSCFIIFIIIFVSASPLKSEAKSLPRTPSIENNHESVENFIYSPLQEIESNMNKETSDANAQTIPVYLIMSPKGDMRTGTKETKPKYADLFDDKGMIYITNPKAARDGRPRISILDDIEDIERRSYSSYDLSRKNQRALKSFVNQELNKKLIAKNAMRRFLDKYDKEYNFNDLVM